MKKNITACCETACQLIIILVHNKCTKINCQRFKTLPNILAVPDKAVIIIIIIIIIINCTWDLC